MSERFMLPQRGGEIAQRRVLSSLCLGAFLIFLTGSDVAGTQPKPQLCNHLQFIQGLCTNWGLNAAKLWGLHVLLYASTVWPKATCNTHGMLLGES